MLVYNYREKNKMKNSFTIFSVYQAKNNDEQNALAHGRVTEALDLLGIEYTEVLGCYKGVVEESIRLEGNRGFDLALMLAELNKQESILAVDSLGNAHLVFVESLNEQSIGVWQESSRDEALSLEAYSKIDGKYFVVGCEERRVS